MTRIRASRAGALSDAKRARIPTADTSPHTQRGHEALTHAKAAKKLWAAVPDTDRDLTIHGPLPLAQRMQIRRRRIAGRPTR